MKLSREQKTYLDANPAAARIWAAVLRRDGEPVSRAEIELLTGAHDRANREIIHEMVAGYSFPIGSLEHAPGGYRLLGTQEDRDAAAAVLEAKADALWARARGLRAYVPEPESEPELQEALFP
jgi:chromosome segregation and condensation protein ScpB